jgi:histidine triad (HIT) family protein
MDPRCIFCEIVAGSSPAHLIDENDHAVAFLDINPATRGHTLVVPRANVPDIWSLHGGDVAPVWALTVAVAHRVRQSLRHDGLTILQSNGEAAWQHVDHLHIHVVPRWKGDGLVRPWTMTPGDPAELEETADRLRASTPGPR